ncbi:MAG: PAS domain-containing protein [Microcoleus sp. PH2017_29_MFU_D_A]|uniref:histidine kinase n=1 Tax=unclassified Microcoleus TaxID=2642155 RepID=UPI001DF8F881|nr:MULTISPECIES: histidine kinase [unclassified Microcoleus]MCC3422409.1 PAS domain-containing protein [Microcoleus sp. PH2017_01_SCD_O_A]MCC3452085.1 PAS domain-containing protein [Microcoleus sp. PH2017_08_TRC_O_A]MCC3606820.1 PAS domain-containing protein [Microcoleus sp. PH2017_29_MFU_D_A]MCC3637863.1 PAS domain-containing protein [Microcoleus sp. PH2017_37_MFU_D_B]
MAVKSLLSSVTKIPSKLSLRTVLIVPLVLQILGIVGFVGYLSFKNGEQAVNELSTQIRQETSAHIQSYIESYLETPHLVNQVNVEAIKSGHLDVFNVKDTKLLERYFARQLQVFKSVSYISVSNEQGGIIGASRHKTNLTVGSTGNFVKGDFAIYTSDSNGNRKNLLSLNPNYDTRTRPWYITLAQAGRPAWSKITTYTDNNVGLTSGVPFFDSTGKLAGILTTDLAISQISTFLQGLRISDSGAMFVIERSGLMVASSTSEKLYVLNQNQQNAQRLKAIESTVPLVRETAKYLSDRFGDFDKINGSQQIDFTIDGKRHFLQISSLKDERGIDWLIIVVVPEDEFVKQIHSNTLTTVLLCVVALVVAMLICIQTIRWITQPILSLNQSAKALAKGNWQQTANTERSDELGELAKSFNTMTHELQASFDEMKTLNEALSQSEKLLENYNQTLEKQVSERTADLQKSEAALRDVYDELRLREQELRLITDALPVCIFYTDANQRYCFVNQTCEAWFGRNRDQILGKLNREILGEVAYQAVEPYVKQVLGGQITTYESELSYSSGKKHISAVYIPDFDRNAQVRGYYGLITDISDRKRAEEASILEERNRMAREIHDTLAQAFTGILLHIGAATEQITKNPERAQAHMETIDELARTGLAEARRSVTTLRPKLLEEGDLYRALTHLTVQMKSSTNTHITCEIIGVVYALSPDVENNLLRIGQEALTNAIRYAHATLIQVELIYEEMQCLLKIKDDGQGFEVEQVYPTKGFGLLGMSERVEQIGGELIIHSQPDRGTEVIVIVNRE